MKPYYQDQYVAIYHGDCREILPQLPDNSVDLVLTDPPYGQGISYGASYDDNPNGYWGWFLPTMEGIFSRFSPTIFTHKVTALKYFQGWDWIGVWNKPGSFGARIGNSPLLPHWEPIFFYGIHQLGVHQDYLADVISANPVKVGGLSLIGGEKWQKQELKQHPAVKPPILFSQIIQCFTQKGEIVLDPFLGSGTTAFCAKKLNRKCIGIEIEEKYCEIAANRCRQMVMELESG